MSVLSQEQIREVFFDQRFGKIIRKDGKSLTELKDYTGERRAELTITQFHDRSEKDGKRILNEWIGFLTKNPNEFEILYFSTRVPQSLFNAVCCQKNLKFLYLKWGGYPDLSALENLKKLQFLYIGTCPSIPDISVLGRMNSLVVLHLENLKKIEDYSPLIPLTNLEQLVITGPILGKTPIKDFEFLREMQNLRSIFVANITERKKYTLEELDSLRSAVPNLHDVYGNLFRTKPIKVN